MNSKVVAVIFIVIIVATAFLSFRAGLLQDSEPIVFIVTSTETTTKTVAVTISVSSTTTNYLTNASPFVVFIDDTPQLRIAWTLPLGEGNSIETFTLLDASNETLISFTKEQGAYVFEKPFPVGMSIGFAALSHPVAIGDSVSIVIVGHSGGLGMKVVYPTVIQVCDPNRTWC